MAIQILGSLQILGETQLPAPTPRTARTLLGLLALHPNRPLSRAQVIDALWGEHPPNSVAANLRTYTAGLRRVVSESGLLDVTLQTGPAGYVLHIHPDALDALQFRVLVAEGQRNLASRHLQLAAEQLTCALALWRGPVLEGTCIPELVRPAAGALNDQRQDALEDSIEARLALGKHRELSIELPALIAESPMRERLCGQLMLALYRSGRQVEALAAYHSLSKLLDDELGVRPFIEIQTLYRRILRADPELMDSIGTVPTGQPTTAAG